MLILPNPSEGLFVSASGVAADLETVRTAGFILHVDARFKWLGAVLSQE